MSQYPKLILIIQVDKRFDLGSIVMNLFRRELILREAKKWEVLISPLGLSQAALIIYYSFAHVSHCQPILSTVGRHCWNEPPRDFSAGLFKWYLGLKCPLKNRFIRTTQGMGCVYRFLGARQLLDFFKFYNRLSYLQFVNQKLDFSFFLACSAEPSKIRVLWSFFFWPLWFKKIRAEIYYFLLTHWFFVC